VAEVTSASGARRSMPTVDELRAWRSLIEVTQALRTQLGSRLQIESGISSGDYAVLLALSEAEGRTLRSSELAATIDWERSRLSHHLGRMERRGLIRRDECATDNRGAEISVTPQGLSIFRSASVPHLRAVRELFVDALTAEQIAAAEQISAALWDHLRARP